MPISLATVPPRVAEEPRPTPVGAPVDAISASLEAIRALEAQLARQQRDALTHIARAYMPSLTRFCQGRLGNREQAEDAVQDVLTKVQGQLGRVESGEHLRNLLFLLAKNRCAELLVARRRHEAPVPWDDDPLEDDEDAAAADREALRAAIAALPKLEDRILLTLSMDYNLPLRLIAQILEISEGACKMRSHRARLKLRKALAQAR